MHQEQNEITIRNESQRYYTISEAARSITIQREGRSIHPTRQAIYVAVIKGNLKATKRLSHHGKMTWMITPEDLEEYQNNKYSTDRRRINGELVFDKRQGRISVKYAADLLSQMLGYQITESSMYYKLRTGEIPCSRKGSTYIINETDLISYYQKLDLSYIKIDGIS